MKAVVVVILNAQKTKEIEKRRNTHQVHIHKVPFAGLYYCSIPEAVTLPLT